MRIVAATIVGIVALGVSAAGCSTQATVSKSTVEQTVKDALAQQVGQTPKGISCAGDLNATVGATERCTLTADDGSTIGLTVTVKTIENGTAKYDVQVDTASPTPGPSGP